MAAAEIWRLFASERLTLGNNKCEVVPWSCIFISFFVTHRCQYEVSRKFSNSLQFEPPFCKVAYSLFCSFGVFCPLQLFENFAQFIFSFFFQFFYGLKACFFCSCSYHQNCSRNQSLKYSFLNNYFFSYPQKYDLGRSRKRGTKRMNLLERSHF